MRVFEIFDTTKRGHRACAVLKYDEVEGKASIRIEPWAAPDDLPFLLAMFLEQGKTKVEHEWAMRWIQERVPPPHRQNIGEILRANHLEEYDEIALLAVGHGRSSQDDFQIREVGPQFDYAAVGLSNEGHGLSHVCEDVGRKIAEARKKAGLTQCELAERTGIDQAVISRIESGKGNPTLETLSILADGMGAELKITFE